MAFQINPLCRLCELHAGGCQSVCVGGDGATTGPIDVLFVGEAPGAEEDEAARPFVGASGRLLRHAIEVYGIDGYRYAITNAVKCRPLTPEGENATPKIKHVRACALYLEEEIERLKPRFIVTLGNVPLRALTGKTGVTNYVGRQIPHVSGAVVFPMLHPAAVLRAEGVNKPQFEAGFEMLTRALSGKEASKKKFREVSVDEFVHRLGSIARAKIPWALDFETGPAKGFDAFEPAPANPKIGRIVTAAVAWGEKDTEVCWVQWPADKGAARRLEGAFRGLLASGATMIAHNAVFEVKWLLNKIPGLTRETRWPVEDTLLFHHLIDENQPHGLEILAAQLTDMGGYDNDMALMLASKVRHHEVPIDSLGNYNAGDALATYKAWKALRPQVMADAGLKRVWTTLTQPTIFSVAWCELNGRKVDFARIETLRRAWTQEAEESLATLLDSKEVADLARRAAHRGEPLPNNVFNPNSPKQVAELLFKIVGVPVLGKTKTGLPSTGADFITPFKKHFPILEPYLTFKGRKKALEMLSEFESYVVPRNGFVYGSYLIHGTVTGRLSSTNPNLQNRDEESRTVVVSRFPDGQIVEADYAQLELRLVAEAAGCRPLLDAFARGEDPHKVTASLMYRVPLDKVTPEQRANGKVANFLLAYGGGPKKLMISGGLPRADAEFVYEAFQRAYPEIGAWMRGIHRIARQQGWVRSATGRIRRVPDARSYNPTLVKAAEREAGNSPIQSLGSDLNTWAFNRVMGLLAERGMETVGLGMTHDSGTYDSPAREVTILAPMLKRVMTVEAPKALVPGLKVRLDVEVKAGPSWGSTKPLVQQAPQPVR